MVDLIRRLTCRRRDTCMAHALSLTSLVAFVTVLAAQTPRSADQPLRFTVFASQAIGGLAFMAKTGAAATKVTFYPTARSPRYEFRGAGPLRFTDASGAVVAEVAVPAEIRDALLLFSPAEAVAGNGLKYRVAVLDDGVARHGTGGLAVINFSGFALSGTIDGKEVTLKDGLNPPQPIGRSGKVLLRTTVKGRTFQSSSETVQLKKAERALLILFPPFYKGSLEVQSRLLIDEPPSAAPAAAAK